ncbi:MAG: ADP-ribose pyrophosphatase [Parcubacteria group bacterium GW2011_GWA1_44_13]|uniref:ADP-ribose pyrophosphatase n=1 Tax=Candidatus Nomurabacteria bacterium GW2011_GWB1_44_12 TaxID=1618748 RepID=A0A837I6K5_9BACT|nr:MAG: ADP-ribose pyrophosphatase [Candidatus Nomurabacteria bacterium GW2011_GWB1_44_12]KKT38279.1 MAG: ADP-ribose pyrophosphatase [Parcubacteria group bacterium GW2011_GWA1_44_13]KKT60525.1 MAG: ADP-ribose pyrophosphatase [Parcubacteria group bacterium GW2011_GWC1_44_26]HBB44489.1 ADP-ribose pyrophosphatase [Candidatus Yonathbacteria bacterium]
MAVIECIARGVIEEEGKILLCRGKGNRNFFFPGGHIEEGESARVALEREIKEELGEDSEVKRFIGASENKFQTKNGEVHEINLVFEVALLSNGGRVSQEDHLEFAWLTREELRDVIVFPKSLKDAVLTLHAKEKPFWITEGFS